ncbi:MAG: hypothetical protein ACJAY5_001473 [Actinomycetes bacterium]|jgi:hypothetical protein
MADPQVDETKDERQCGGGGPKRGGQVHPGKRGLIARGSCAHAAIFMRQSSESGQHSMHSARLTGYLEQHEKDICFLSSGTASESVCRGMF